MSAKSLLYGIVGFGGTPVPLSGTEQADPENSLPPASKTSPRKAFKLGRGLTS